MSDPESVLSRVAQHLAEASDEEIEAGEISADASLRDDLQLSSLQAITMVMDLEDEFDLVVEDEELGELRTVADIVRLIEGKGGSPDEAAS